MPFTISVANKEPCADARLQSRRGIYELRCQCVTPSFMQFRGVIHFVTRLPRQHVSTVSLLVALVPRTRPKGSRANDRDDQSGLGSTHIRLVESFEVRMRAREQTLEDFHGFCCVESNRVAHHHGQ